MVTRLASVVDRFVEHQFSLLSMVTPRAIELQEFRRVGLEGRLDFYWSLHVTRFMGAILRPTLASWAWP
jgi:hypothetical protein